MRNYTLYVKFNALIVGTIFVCGLLAASLFLYSTSTYMNYELDTSARAHNGDLGCRPCVIHITT